MAERLVSHRNLLAEIKRSKASFCYQADSTAFAFDAVADSFEEMDRERVGFVYRVMTWEHIPIEENQNRRLQGEARNRATVNFHPFKHYRITKAGPVEVVRSHWRGDPESGCFSVSHGRLTSRLGLMIVRAVEGIAMRGNFRNYSYREEMVGDAIMGLCANILRYDDSKDTSAFAYLTTIATNDMVKRLKKEKLAQSVRDDLLQDAGSAPSMARQMESELARFEPVKLLRAKRRARHVEGSHCRRLSGWSDARIAIIARARSTAIAPSSLVRDCTLRAPIIFECRAAAMASKRTAKRSTNLAKCLPHPIEKGPRPKRSAEAIAAAAAKLRMQREARIAATLPLVEEARANGCVLLRDICTYLDRLGHKPPQGQHWSTATLSKMLPKSIVQRTDAYDGLISQARAEGASTYQAVADWLNRNGHKTAHDKLWTGANVKRFDLSRRTKSLNTAASNAAE